VNANALFYFAFCLLIYQLSKHPRLKFGAKIRRNKKLQSGENNFPVGLKS